MKKIKFGGEIPVSSVVLGCMRISSLTLSEITELIYASYEGGINFFDHADIYGGGKCESLFGQAFIDTKIKREEVFIQSKCAIHDGIYDFSYEHIIKSVDGILFRLKTEYLDSLLLHRPDTLMEPEEVALAFSELKEKGKVKYFGVSNQNPSQMNLLTKYAGKLYANQLQLSPTNTTMIDTGINVNMENEGSINRDGGVLEYCRLNDITIQAWSPYQFGFFGGAFLGNPQFENLNEKIKEISKKYNITDNGTVAAWILRHPADMQIIAGTTKIKRIKEICCASDVCISRNEWYDIYKSAGNILP